MYDYNNNYIVLWFKVRYIWGHIRCERREETKAEEANINIFSIDVARLGSELQITRTPGGRSTTEHT